MGVCECPSSLLALQNGCICCTLREDLLVEVAELAASGKFDYLVIESTGVSEPLPVAETFTFDAGKNPLMSLARLDTMVTVIDGLNFAEDLESMDYLDDRDWAPKDEDDRNVSQLLIEQIEFADVVVINKTDLISDEQAGRISGLVSVLNPRAKQIRCVRGAVDLSEILNTHLFDMDVAAKVSRRPLSLARQQGFCIADRSCPALILLQTARIAAILVFVFARVAGAGLAERAARRAHARDGRVRGLLLRVPGPSPVPSPQTGRAAGQRGPLVRRAGGKRSRGQGQSIRCCHNC
jgi:G3E family GTPase